MTLLEGSSAKYSDGGSGSGKAALRSVMSPEAFDARLDGEAESAVDFLRAQQREDGHWLYELEADATIPAEYILLNHFLGEPEPLLKAKMAKYLRRIQSDRHHGWPLFHDGDFDLSASIKAYFALKLAGDGPDAAHMVRARNHPRPWRCRPCECLHADHPRLIQTGPLARHTSDADRHHVAAELVTVQHPESVLLVTNGHRAVADPDVRKTMRGQPRRH